MRQIFASVPRGKGAETVAIAAARHGANLAWFPATGQDGGCDSNSEIQEQLATAIQEELRKAEPHTTPLVSITILN